MKKTRILYWLFTLLFGAFMMWSGIPGIIPNEQSVQFMHEFLGYPVYFIPFISVAKVFGAIAILTPGFNKIKEWAYAGLFYDLIGAIYSVIAASGKLEAGTLFLLLPIILGALSYYYWKRVGSN
jgi:DoxX-like family